VSSYIAALGSCDLSWGVNERIIANALIEIQENFQEADFKLPILLSSSVR
jgi:hypothetical protein